MEDNSIIIESSESNNNNNTNNNNSNFLLEDSIFKNIFSDDEDDLLKLSGTNAEKKDNLKDDNKLLSSLNDSFDNSQIYFSTPIHKNNNSHKNVRKNEDKNNNSHKNFRKNEDTNQKRPIEIIIDDDSPSPKKENSFFILSPASQPGFKNFNNYTIDIDNIDLKIDEILNSSNNALSHTRKNKKNKVDNNSKDELNTNPKENISLTNFKVDSDKFDKFSIFNKEKQQNNISFERIKRLNYLFNKEIEKKKKGNEEEEEEEIDWLDKELEFSSSKKEKEEKTDWLDKELELSSSKKEKEEKIDWLDKELELSSSKKEKESSKDQAKTPSKLNYDKPIIIDEESSILGGTHFLSDDNIVLSTNEIIIDSSPSPFIRENIRGMSQKGKASDDGIIISPQNQSFLNDNLFNILNDSFSLISPIISKTNDTQATVKDNFLSMSSEVHSSHDIFEESNDDIFIIDSQLSSIEGSQNTKSSKTKEDKDKSKKRKRNNTASQQQRELEKEKKKKIQEELKLQKKRDRDLQKQLQKMEREEKLLKRKEQNRIEKLNKLKTKVEACKEMIICMDIGFQMTEDYEYVNNIFLSSSQVAENEDDNEMIKDTQEHQKSPSGELLEQKLKGLNVDVQFKEYPIPNTITWKRRVDYLYDENLKIYKGTKKEYVINEDFVLLRISALDFASKASTLEEVESFLNEIKEKYEPQLKNSPLEDKLLKLSSDNHRNGMKKKRWIFLIEGIKDYYRKRSILENRKMREIMKSQLTPNRPKRHRKETVTEEPVIDPRSFCGVDMGKYFKLKGPLSDYPSKQVLEEAFLLLQMTGECLVIFSSGWENTVEWICTFTKEIAITPFK